MSTPTVRQVVLDCPDVRVSAEFYRALLGWEYRPGDELPPVGEPDPRGSDWLVLRNPAGVGLSFQQVAGHQAPTWPEGPRPQMVHLDMSVADTTALVQQRDRVLELGGQQLYDRFDDSEEPLFVMADPAGHPFCIFVG